jgi:hypothetical protein
MLLLSIFKAVADDTPETFDESISHAGQNYTIRYEKVNFYSPDCKFLLHRGDDAWSVDSYVTYEHGPCRTYIGRINEDPAAVAIGYLRADGSVRGKIIFAEAGRGVTLDFDRGQPTHNQDVIGKLAESSFYWPPIDTPGKALVEMPSRRLEMGAEVSYVNFNRLGKSIPATLEAFEFGFAPVFLTACADAKARPLITQFVIRTNRQGCPYMSADQVAKKQMASLPDGSTGWDSKVIREVWNKLWPAYEKKKKTVMGGSNVAAGGGNASSVLMEEHPNVALGWATPDYTFTHEFAHNFGGLHATSRFEGFTAFAGYPHTIRLGGADVMQFMGMADLKIANGAWDGFAECRGDDVQVPPYAAFDFVKFQPDRQRAIAVDVARNDYDYNRDTPTLVSVDPKTRRGRALEVKPDHSGKPLVMVQAMPDRLGFDMFRYRIADQSGFQSEGYTFLEALRPYTIYEAEDVKLAKGGTGKPRQNRSNIPKSTTYLPLGQGITWKVRVDHSGTYGLKFRYQLYAGEGVSASGKLSLSVNGETLSSKLPVDDTQVTHWWNYCVYPDVPLKKGDNEITLSLSGDLEIKAQGRKAKARKNIQPLIDYLMVYDGIDYCVNFGASRYKSVLNAVYDEGQLFALHPENGLSYGWAKRGIGTYSVVRQRQAPDPRMRAGVTWPGRIPNNYWEIELPNGTYNVHLVCGGIAKLDELEAVAGWEIDGSGNSIGLHSGQGGKAPYINDFLVEGVRVQNTDHQRIYSFMDCKVTVKDGRLTIMSGASAENPRLAFLRISQCE